MFNTQKKYLNFIMTLKSRNAITNLHDKTEYVIHKRNLK